MAVLSGATASALQMYNNTLGTASATLYTAPAYNSNVTSPSATAIVKEIVLCNTTASPVTVTVGVGAVALVYNLSIAANDSKVLSGLNTMMSPSQTVYASAGTASAIACTVSGVAIQ